MDKNEIDRLQKGQKLLKQIESVDQQIEQIKKVKFINLGTSKEVKIRNEYGYMDDLTTEQVVNCIIPLNTEDKYPHPFSTPTKAFVQSLIRLLDEKKMILQKQFDEL